MRTLYRELMGRTRAVVRQAERALRQVARGTVRGVGLAQVAVEDLAQQLRGTVPGRRVLAQTRAPSSRGTHYPDKLLSLFEPHTEAIREGKVVKPTEFGKLVKDPGGGGAVHHRLRGLRHPGARSDAVGALAKPARGTLWPRPAPGRGRWRLCLPGE